MQRWSAKITVSFQYLLSIALFSHFFWTVRFVTNAMLGWARAWHAWDSESIAPS